ncbi:MAG: hypothetical protein ACXAC2_04470, partial [Candidatus Kariarchaeaceae archaeon]
MYVITIHGFNAKIPFYHWLQKLWKKTPEPGVWKIGDKITNPKVEKLGYKDVIYKEHGWTRKKGGEV